MSWSLRPAEVAEAAALSAVVDESFRGYVPFAPPGWEPRTDDPERLARELRDPGSFTRVADTGGAIAGFTHFVPDPDGEVDVYLRHLFVREPYWGTGLARTLHGALVEALGERSARLNTPAGQARARAFYEREGWWPHRTFDDERFGMLLVEYRR